ncbi:MAG: ATP-binding protein [Aestuariivirga sp.]|uniref:ATP-binding protein n=1 Tax=Aestuariivirga sp. TaxID=2650926 RepID=UPI0038D211EE
MAASMLDDSQLLSRFRNAESDLVERKRSLSDKDKIRQAICAFANDLPGHGKPGTIFIGQNDDGTCAGLKIDDQVLLELSQLRDDGLLQPIPSLTVARKSLDNCDVAVVEVYPSQNPPVRLNGRPWIRVGPRRAVATGEEERRLLEKRRWGALPFDAQGVAGADEHELDLARLQLELLRALVPSDVLMANDRPINQQLKALRLLNNEGSPTVSGLLTAGKSPQTWIPGSYIQFLRIDGIELTDPLLDSRTISGTLPDQISELDRLMAVNIRVGSKVGGALRLDAPDYPIVALRQLSRNALVHRSYEGTNSPVRITWYADRIEILSPGGPYGQVNAGNFGTGVTDYRNPTIAGLMVQLGFMERFGIGIAIAQKALAENGNPPVRFEVNDQFVLAIVRPAA